MVPIICICIYHHGPVEEGVNVLAGSVQKPDRFVRLNSCTNVLSHMSLGPYLSSGRDDSLFHSTQFFHSVAAHYIGISRPHPPEKPGNLRLREVFQLSGHADGKHAADDLIEPSDGKHLV